MRKVLVLAIILATACTSVALADTLKKGDNELQFGVNYNAISFPDEPTVKTYNINGQWGYMITEGNELGITLGYAKTVGTPEVDASSSQKYGVFWDYNFKAGEITNPFVGVNFVGLSGDLGDIANYTYGATVGAKVYPWANAGFIFAFTYDWYQGGPSDLGNATDWFLSANIGVKF